MTNQQYVSDMSTFITKLSQKTYNRLGNQSIVVGTIEEARPGYYLVTILNSDDLNKRKATSITGGNYSVGDYVYLIKTTVNSGDTFDSAYFILGKVTDNNKLNETELENYLDTYFFVSGSSFQVAINEENETISDITDTTGKDLLDKIKEKGYFQIEGNFTSQSKDNYGLQISIHCSDATDIFEFLSKDFSGQPFQLIKSSQFKNFALDKTRGKTIQSISITKIGTFTIENLYISAGFIENNQIQLSLDLKAVNDKNYFFNKEEKVELAATAYYKDQPIDFPELQYYWYIKDNSSEVLPYVGSGWSVINPKLTETILGIGKNSFYNTENPSLTLYIDNCQSFENIFKCVFLYKGFYTESNEIKVYNYLKEDIDAELTADKESITLIKRNEDQAVLTCSIENKNENIKNIEILTKWQAKTGSGEYFDITTTSEKVSCINAKEKNLNFVLSENEIIHKGSLKATVVSASRETAIDESICYIQINKEVSEEIFIRAVLYVYDTGKKVLNNIPVAETEPIKIKSYVKEYEEGIVIPEVRYQYWITDNPQSKFNYSDTDKHYYLLDDSERLKMGVCFNSLEELYSNDIIDADTLNNMIVNKEYYIFYSSQTYYAVAADIEIEADKFTVPKIIRTIEKTNSGEIVNVKNEKEVTQLNNFNSLTRNGASQGLFYTSEGYTETLDESPQADKTYCVVNIVYSPQQKERDTNLKYYTFNEQTKKYDEVAFNDEGFNSQETYYITNPINTTEYLKLSIRDSWLADKIYYIYDDNIKNYKIIPTDGTIDFSSTQIYYLQTQEGYRIAGEDDFNEGNFKDDVIYYEKQRAGDVYINASYIQTGTLRVGEEGNEIFYASVNNPEVKIGGFNVGKDKLVSTGTEIDENGIIPEVYVGIDKIGLGKKDDGSYVVELDKYGGITGIDLTVEELIIKNSQEKELLVLSQTTKDIYMTTPDYAEEDLFYSEYNEYSFTDDRTPTGDTLGTPVWKVLFSNGTSNTSIPSGFPNVTEVQMKNNNSRISFPMNRYNTNIRVDQIEKILLDTTINKDTITFYEASFTKQSGNRWKVERLGPSIDMKKINYYFQEINNELYLTLSYSIKNMSPTDFTQIVGKINIIDFNESIIKGIFKTKKGKVAKKDQARISFINSSQNIISPFIRFPNCSIDTEHVLINQSEFYWANDKYTFQCGLNGIYMGNFQSSSNQVKSFLFQLPNIIANVENSSGELIEKKLCEFKYENDDLQCYYKNHQIPEIEYGEFQVSSTDKDGDEEDWKFDSNQWYFKTFNFSKTFSKPPTVFLTIETPHGEELNGAGFSVRATNITENQFTCHIYTPITECTCWCKWIAIL